MVGENPTPKMTPNRAILAKFVKNVVFDDGRFQKINNNHLEVFAAEKIVPTGSVSFFPRERVKSQGFLRGV